MPWSLLALITALCETGRDLVVRHLIRRSGLSSGFVMGSSCLLTAGLAMPLAVALAPPPQWKALAISLLATAVVNGLAFWAYGRALGRGDLSLVLPLINLSPLVLLLSGWDLLGERPAGLALAGVLMVVIGALELGRTTGSPGNLLGSPGARSMLLVAVLCGIGASIVKHGVLAAGSLTWVAGLNLVVGPPLLLTEALSRRGTAAEPDQDSSWARWVVLVAVLGLVGMALQMEALQRTAVVHVIAIKRLSTLFSAIVGVVALGEPSGTVRLPAAALMLGGGLVVLRFASG